LIGWLRGSLQRGGKADLLGDDAALFPGSPGTMVATVDSQVAGVHVPEDLDAGLLAARLLHVNLSDLAAMGTARSRSEESASTWCHALVTLATPEAFDHRHFFSVLLDECAAAGVALAGGDLASSRTLTATMTLMAHQPDGWRPVRRSGARPGDALWIGGTVGESGAGLRLLRRGARLTAHGERAHVFLPPELRGDGPVADAARRAVRRHLRPRAQLELGAWLSSRPEGEHPAGLDLSDGAARDLPRLARESGVGLELDAAELPLSEGFTELCAALESDPIDLALGGGEDYVLAFALPEGVQPPTRFRCRRVGRVRREKELVLVRNGKREAWPEMGWDHLG
jgi:thiamine-monophosphate kinase